VSAISVSTQVHCVLINQSERSSIIAACYAAGRQALQQIHLVTTSAEARPLDQQNRPCQGQGVGSVGLNGARIDTTTWRSQGVRIALTDGAFHAVDSSELAFKLASVYAFRAAYSQVTISYPSCQTSEHHFSTDLRVHHVSCHSSRHTWSCCKSWLRS